MRRHLAYGRYVLRHKWFVFLACLKLRVPFHQAVLHDWSKFLPGQWVPYARHFYNTDGSSRKVRDEAGAYNPAAQEIPFQAAWLHHQRLRHHWQAWVVLGDEGYVTPLPMSERFIREMVADWVGAGRAISGRSNPCPWYEANQDKMKLHPETRRAVCVILARHFA